MHGYNHEDYFQNIVTPNIIFGPLYWNLNAAFRTRNFCGPRVAHQKYMYVILFYANMFVGFS